MLRQSCVVIAVMFVRFESNILKFLNFAIYVSDAKLAHVVFTTSHAFSRNILDARELLPSFWSCYALTSPRRGRSWLEKSP
jgi:hypothetical protein